MKIRELLTPQLIETASAGGTSSGNIASFVGVGGGSKVGTLFGGSYQQKRPGKKQAKKPNESIIRR